jgi:hypothetical protein
MERLNESASAPRYVYERSTVLPCERCAVIAYPPSALACT